MHDYYVVSIVLSKQMSGTVQRVPRITKY